MDRRSYNKIEYILAFILLTFFCFFINKDIIIKALYMDDLFHWSWFRGLNFYDFAIKFYESPRYRPVFNAVQYLFYFIIDTDPTRYSIINKIYNSTIAVFIYYFIRKMELSRIVSFAFSILFLISHFCYYQIGQGIGSLETTAHLLAILLLYFCLRFSSVILDRYEDNDYVKLTKYDLAKYINIIYVLYFLASFTHERFMGLCVPIFISIVFYKTKSKNKKFIKKSLIILIIEIAVICTIRQFATGRVLPAGTGGTYVEETFKITECIKFCFMQVAMILGFNFDPEYLYGIKFLDISNIFIKLGVLVSILFITISVLIYIFTRVKYKSKTNALAADLIFLSFLATTIGSSSVTIRAEMRFVYVSFTASILYLLYMWSFIIKNVKLKVTKLLSVVICLLIVIFRLPVEMEYRKSFDKIHCFVDLKRVNSIYDNTIGKYGLNDILHKKKIYVINKYYGMTEFYSEYILKIYDKNDVGNKMILVKDFSEIDKNDINDDTIILYEDLNDNDYKQYEIE